MRRGNRIIERDQSKSWRDIRESGGIVRLWDFETRTREDREFEVERPGSWKNMVILFLSIDF